MALAGPVFALFCIK